MTKRTTHLRIAPQPDQPGLSKAQRSFNSLIKKIAVSRETLALWQSTMAVYRQKVASDYTPLIEKYRQLQAELVHSLDKALDRKGLMATERRYVQSVICDIAEQLVIDTGDAALKAIYNKHSDTDFDAEESAALDSVKASLEKMFDVEFEDDDDGTSPEEIIAKLRDQAAEEDARFEEAEKNRTQRKKTAKQLAREEKAKIEADKTSLSIREVYRKLVSALHPDREPDADERARKTALIQRANEAYEKKDLLRLLELQLELEQIDGKTIAGMSEDRIKRFNRILEDQWREVELENAEYETSMQELLGVPLFQPLPTAAVMPRLLRDIAALRRDIKQLEYEIPDTRNVAALKAWIKAWRRRDKEFRD
ncbi:MAG: hypothetical protein ABL931_08530 [Usitatibacteraceae bacterium]